MIFCIHIGNTHLTLAGMDKTIPRLFAQLATDKEKTDFEYAREFFTVLSSWKKKPEDFEEIALSSAVPRLSIIVSEAVRRVFSKSPLLLSSKKYKKLHSKLDNPSALGGNLLADAIAVKSLYPLPAIFVDMGTVTSMGVLDENGIYLGGAILPGLQVSVNALTSKAAQLSGLRVKDADSVIAKNTVDSINSGALFGWAGMIDEMVFRMSSELLAVNSKAPALILTGRISHLLIPKLKNDFIYDESLTMKGLSLFYEERKEELK